MTHLIPIDCFFGGLPGPLADDAFVESVPVQRPWGMPENRVTHRAAFARGTTARPLGSMCYSANAIPAEWKEELARQDDVELLLQRFLSPAKPEKA